MKVWREEEYAYRVGDLAHLTEIASHTDPGLDMVAEVC